MVKRNPLPIRATVLRSGSSFLFWSLRWLLLGAALAALAYQVPARHEVAVGWNDGGYVQGFGDAVNRWGVVTEETGEAQPYRWSRPSSAVIFPQIGLPAEASLRWRGLRSPGDPAPRVRVLLNGVVELGVFESTGEWEEHTFRIDEGLWKPRDLFLQIETVPAVLVDGEERGVQVSRASLRTTRWPIVPYPAQIVGAALAAWLLALAAGRRPPLVGALIGTAMLIFLLGYRLQALPYPPRLLWPAAVGLALAATVVRRVAEGARPDRRLLDGAAAATILVWVIGVGWAGRAHVTLARPGVENDFRVFATRSDLLGCPPGADLAQAGCVLRADGFYQLGYPLLLWLARPFTSGNAFLAGRALALLAAVALLVATYGLGRTLLGPAGGLLALLLAALNRWTAEYALLVGTDMPFAAAWTLGTLAIITVRGRKGRALLAGVLCGLAFAIRHPGIALLPLGAAILMWQRGPEKAAGGPRPVRARLLLPAYLLLGFVLASLPQLVVNTLQTGRPLFSQQAKNIWLAVYGNTDWAEWDKAANSVRLADVVLHDPARFMANWWGNVRAFFGTGGEDTSEFGRSLSLRLLAFPANLVALAGLLRWLGRGGRVERWLLLVALLYVLALSVGFMLPRFVVPLVPVWALAASAAVVGLWEGGVLRFARVPSQRRAVAVTTALLLVVMAAGSTALGVREVLTRQDPDGVAMTALVRRTVGPGERIVDELEPDDPLLKYSAIAHLSAQEAGVEARFVLRDDEGAPADPGASAIARAGRYTLWERQP